MELLAVLDLPCIQILTMGEAVEDHFKYIQLFSLARALFNAMEAAHHRITQLGMEEMEEAVELKSTSLNGIDYPSKTLWTSSIKIQV
jgi:hypothetical protein